MNPLTNGDAAPVDAYVACHASLAGWGGGLSLARGAGEALRSIGLTANLLGVRRSSRDGAGAFNRFEAPLDSSRWTWRFQNFLTAGQIAHWLGSLPRPREAFVAVSPYWADAARRTWPKLPIVYLFPCMLSTCLQFSRFGPMSLVSRLNRAALHRLERRAFRVADLTIAPTRLAYEEIVEFESGAARSTRVCAFGCHAPAFDAKRRAHVRASLGLEPDDLVVLLAGVMDRNKAFDVAIRELPKCPGSVRLLIVGDGSEKSAFRKLAIDLDVSRRVVFLDPQPALAGAIAACDLAASTSGYDTYPNVLLEALAAGRPILAPRHDPPHTYAGIAELIQHGGGVLFERTQAGAFAAAVAEIAGDHAFRRRLVAQAIALRPRLEWTGLAAEFKRFLQPQPADSCRVKPTEQLEPVHVA
ncbi:MAG: glycosyltransferase [Planctomycetes bacterium]|nr:glycosyltransferase [Planctomycetota bacterium]